MLGDIENCKNQVMEMVKCTEIDAEQLIIWWAAETKKENIMLEPSNITLPSKVITI